MSGLIQKVDVTTAAPEQPNGTAVENSNGNTLPAWYWDDEKPGDGERPEWLDAKFKSIKDLAASYKELEKHKGLNVQVPEDYDLNDYAELMDLESPHIANLKNKAKELKLSQDAMKQLVDGFANYQKSLIPNTDEEIEKLGPNAKVRIDTINRWASNHLSEKSLDTLGKISSTAEVFDLMDELRSLHVQTASKVPTGHAPVKAEIESITDIQNEMINDYARYERDPKYRQEITRRLAVATGEDL